IPRARQPPPTGTRGGLAAKLHAGGPVSAAALAGGALAALVAIATLTLAMRRHPQAFPVLAVIALPFRLPISTDGLTVNLLLPLYAVVAAGVLAHLLPRLLGRRGG